MENVIAFNNELSGLYDSKPPISKAKMASITKAAMRAIKFYKHVVQSVEKFILKCKPEYKVPGLYVIDSIVRQSRHQYGPEKDVFAPRFARNLKETFINLFRCPHEDKSRIIRVLNLWQKNSVFAPDVIQPIFDLADPNHPIYQLPQAGIASGIINDMNSSTSNGINNSTAGIDMSLSNTTLGNNVDDKMGALPDLSNNNLQQLLNDPNVIRQLQTLQNIQKFKQEDKQHNEMRLQEEAFEKHLQNVLKASGTSIQDASDFNKEVEFVSEEQKIEVINLDGNSRSPTPDRDRYRRRRSRTRSRSRDRGSGRDRNRRRRSLSRSRSRSPRSRRRVSRDRDRSNRDKDKDREHERERRKKGLPEIKKEHLSVCSTTLWVGHLSKLVYQEELSDTFGEYGDIVSIDQIVPRGCAFIVMNRRQDAYKAMQNLKNHKLQGRAITISWAAGKGVKSKEWKDYWDLDLGVTYIPWSKLDESTDFDSLEEGGMFDEDSMPSWMKDKISHIKGIKERTNDPSIPAPSNMLFNIDTTQPPPGPPPLMPMVPGQFPIAPPMGAPPRMLAPMGMQMSGIPMPNLVPGMPPPHAMMMATGLMPPAYPPGVGGHMGMTPTAAQFPPPPNISGNGSVAMQSGVGNISNDDQMDIEMEVEDAAAPVVPSSQMNFNQPPPMFATGLNSVTGTINEPTDMFTRERNRNSSGQSRWSGRNTVGDDESVDTSTRWRENGSSTVNIVNFGDNRSSTRNGAPLNIPPLDLNNPPQRPDFLNDFDNRSGPRGTGGSRSGNQNNGDFFVNMQTRFNQPTSLLQMRIPPPTTFNQRMGGPGAPMFMRGQGGRQQGPGFFNTRNAFDRENVRGGRGGGARSGNRGGRGSGSVVQIWSDDEDDGGSSFKRRGNSGNRFRDRENLDDRSNRERAGGRRIGTDRNTSRDRQDRDVRDSDRDRGSRHLGSNRGGSRDENPITEQVSLGNVPEHEEDWDQESDNYNAVGPNVEHVSNTEENTQDNITSDVKYNESAGHTTFEQIEATDTVETTDTAYSGTKLNDDKRKEIAVAQNTPLYDELPGSSTVTSTTSPKVASPQPLIDMGSSIQATSDDMEKAVETTTSTIEEQKLVE